MTRPDDATPAGPPRPRPGEGTVVLTYPFTEQEAQAAYDEWGCNCGPTSLAFVLQVPLDRVRHAIPGFAERRYTNPTMMRAGLAHFGRTATAYSGPDGPTIATMFGRSPALVRVQWTGPWTEPGANPKWAYRQTHWVVAYAVEGQAPMVFDCNGGIRGFKSWQAEIVPALTADIPRADGGWFPTHVWRVD